MLSILFNSQQQLNTANLNKNLTATITKKQAKEKCFSFFLNWFHGRDSTTVSVAKHWGPQRIGMNKDPAARLGTEMCSPGFPFFCHVFRAVQGNADIDDYDRCHKTS